MTPSSILFFTLTFLIGKGLAETPFSNDTPYHTKHKLRPLFEKADANKDGVITILDKGGWWHNRKFDHNNDSKVELSEIVSAIPLNNAEITYQNIVYKQASGEKCLMDIYLPKKTDDSPMPVLYFTHGGGWVAGTKDLPPNMTSVFERMLAEGIACVSVSYRLVQNDRNHPVVMEDCVTDCRDGLRFLKKHASYLNIDSDKVMTFGNSAGGHLCLMLAYAPPTMFLGDKSLSAYDVAPIAGINWYGPVSFLDGQLFIPPVEGWTGNPNRFAGRMSKNGEACEYSDASESQKRLMERLSPMTYFDKNSVPILTIHGTDDGTIPIKHSKLLHKKAVELGAPVEFISVQGAGHGFNDKNVPPFSEIENRMVTFAKKHLLKN